MRCTDRVSESKNQRPREDRQAMERWTSRGKRQSDQEEREAETAFKGLAMTNYHSAL